MSFSSFFLLSHSNQVTHWLNEEKRKEEKKIEKLAQLLDFKQPNYSFHRKLNDLFCFLSICAQGLIINIHWASLCACFILFTFLFLLLLPFFNSMISTDGLYQH